MPVVTFADFKARVARKLGVLAIGESLSAEDADVIGASAEDLAAQTDALDLLTVDWGTGIEDVYADVFADMVAASLVDEFVIPEPRATRMRRESAFGMNPPTMGERKFRRLVDGVTTPLAVTTDFTIGR